MGSIVGYAKGTVSNYIRKFADDVRYLLDSFVGKIVTKREKEKENREYRLYFWRSYL